MPDKEIYLGIDPSIKNTGLVAISSPQNILWQEIVSLDTSKRNYLYDFYNKLEEVFEKLRPKIVTVEGYAFGKGYHAHQLGEIGGIIKLLCFLEKMKLIIVPPAKLKVFIAGNGKATKELILLETYKNFGLEFGNSHLAEAYALALIGFYKISGGFESLIERQRKIVESVG